MMKKWVPLLLTIAANQSWATILCPTSEQYLYQGISCCKKEFSKSECKRVIDQKISTEIKTLTLHYQREGLKTNCHYTALAYFLKELRGDPSSIDNERYILELLLLDGAFVESKMSEESNLMQLWLVGYEKNLDDNGPVPRMIWKPITKLFHSAVHLGSGIYFQKESAGDFIYSIGHYKNIVDSYERGLSEAPFKGHLRGKLISRNFIYRGNDNENSDNTKHRFLATTNGPLTSASQRDLLSP